MPDTAQALTQLKTQLQQDTTHLATKTQLVQQLEADITKAESTLKELQAKLTTAIKEKTALEQTRQAHQAEIEKISQELSQ